MRFITFCLVFLAASMAMAKDFAVGTVDYQRIFDNYPGTIRAEKKFNDFVQGKQNELTDSQKVILGLQDELKKPKAKLSAATKKKRESEIEAKAKALMAKKNVFENDIANRKKEIQLELTTQVNDIISDTAEKDDLDLVVDGSSTHYVRNGKDITAEILDGYSKKK